MATNIGTIFHVVNKTKYAFLTTLLGVVAFVVTSLIGIDRYGLISVIIGQILGSFVMFFSRYIFTIKYTENRFDWIKIVTMLIMYAIISVICYMSNIVVNIVMFIIIFLLICYLNRELLLNMCKKIIKRGENV